MHKSQLISALSYEANIARQDADKVVNAFFSCIEEGLIRGDRTEIRGLGSFRVKNYPGYIGRNPKTGEAIEVPPKRIPFFRVGRKLKAVVAVESQPIENLDDLEDMFD
ncbi:MAG: integration host factor subunit beta [Deltaproteobacteria bacterium]|jgi:integration host factor subunit beta|nr:integration host factor subunit beta [Deltaproteobacteria bacterium]